MEREPHIWKRIQALVQHEMDSVRHIQAFALRLDGKPLIVLQRSFADYASDSKSGRLNLIFDIAQTDNNALRVVHRKSNREDEDEWILGTIRMKNGREFLVSVVSDPESQFFRVYGIQNGNPAIVFSGDGSSC